MNLGSKTRDAAYDDAIEAFVVELELNIQASPQKLLNAFPERASEIERLVAAARQEIHQNPNEELPPIPEQLESSDSKTLIGNPKTCGAIPAANESIIIERVDALPTQLGAYELVEKIGQGGMGEVYRALQRNPIKREVAIKIVRPEIGGRELMGRFENERRSLARMNHPNIATVLDGGSTEDGRPYLVMELVSGIGVTDYCIQHQLAIRGCLSLFLKVCAGVQHAHQKGIIHRDIKPSNILVSKYDHEPVPKVIDFGLAKALTDVDGMESSHTQLGQILGTLQYMSPEQASLQSDRVDTRSDIFSLGVILFELLTGTTPLDKDLSSNLAVDERLRRVRQQEPTRPSDRLRSSMRSQPNSKHSSSSWGAAPLRGDLDAICLKALASDPVQRYETVAELADDVDRFLDNRPVLATKYSEFSLILKYILRHRVAVAVSALFVCLLVVASLISTALAYKALVAEALAERRSQDLSLARDRAENNLYVAHMNLVQQAVNEGDLQQARSYLSRHLPADGEQDRRGFEWYYWNRKLSRFLGESDTGQETMAVAYAPSGKYVVSTGGNGVVQFWDPASRELIREFRGGRDYLGSVAISSDESLLATAGRDGFVKLWDLNHQDKLLHAFERDDMMRSVAFSGNNELLFAGGTNGLLRVFDVASGEELAEFRAHENDIYALAVSPDDQWLASAGGDDLVKIWNLRTWECNKTLKGHRGRARAVAFSPDGDLLASGSYDGTAIIWDLATGEPLHHLEKHTEQVYGVAFSPDGKTLATCSRDESIRLWDVASGEENNELRGHRFTVYAIAYAPNGQTLVSASHDKTIKLWDIGRKPELSLFEDHADAVRDIAFSQNSALLASAGDDAAILVYSLPSGELLNEFRADHGAATTIAFLPGMESGRDERVIAGYEDGTLIVNEVRSGVQIAEFAGHNDYVFSVAVSPNKKQFATVSADQLVKLWDANTLELQNQIEGHTDQIMSVAYSPDGRTLVTAGDAELIAWNLEHLAPVYDIQSGGQRIYSVCFSADGKRIAYGGRDRLVHICDSQTGRQVIELKGHSASVHSIQLDVDGRTAVSGGTDMQLKFWDLTTGEVKSSLGGHDLPIMMVRFSPDCQILASADGRGTVRLWYR